MKMNELKFNVQYSMCFFSPFSSIDNEQKQKIYFSALRRDAKTLKLIFSYGFFVSLLDDKTCCKYVKTMVEKTEEGKRKTLEVY
jgi:hypothetical protein